MLSIFTDGGARGNPGPAAYGVFIKDDRGVLAAFGKHIGNATNNVAEYQAVIEALRWLRNHKDVLAKQQKITLFLDSELVCRQLLGKYKVKNETLKELFATVLELLQIIKKPVAIIHVPREKNKEADKQVNNALDNIS